MESANELFFLAMERKIGCQKPVYPADRSSEGSLRARRRPRAITEAELSDHSLSRTFDITIPPGALFYPCCGSDTRDPLLMFLDSAVDEFHFVDARFIPPIPKIISQPTSSQYHPNHAPIHEVPFLRNQSLGTIFIPHQERQHDLNIQLLEGKKVKAICHCLDGFLSLKYKINNDLAVFYYRGDSAGEGGSGQWWLGHELFNEVLDRLVDGALIVTDGSNFYPNATDLPWSNLWQAGDLLNKGISGEDLSFVWRERSFRLLGQCGRRYGPVYAWQVSRLK